MPCNSCTRKFGFLTKEHHCSSCSLSYCSSCIIKMGGEGNVKVCRNCHTKLYRPVSKSESSEGQEKIRNIDPPDIFRKRLEALENPSKPPITMYNTQRRMQELMKGLSSQDLEIARRLEKLREERRSAMIPPSDDEIARRLALLRDQEPSIVSNAPPKAYYNPPDTRTSEEQAHHLFQEVSALGALDSKEKPEDEIFRRLECLRGRGASESSMMETSSSQPGEGASAANKDDAGTPITLDEVATLLAECKLQGKNKLDVATVASLEQLRARLMQHKERMEVDTSSDDTQVAQIIAKAQAEAELEKRLRATEGSDECMDDEAEVRSDEEELPWCIICNEDAAVCCMDCDRDLYCTSCFNEGHNDPDMHGHLTVPYKKKK